MRGYTRYYVVVKARKDELYGVVISIHKHHRDAVNKAANIVDGEVVLYWKCIHYPAPDGGTTINNLTRGRMSYQNSLVYNEDGSSKSSSYSYQGFMFPHKVQI